MVRAELPGIDPDKDVSVTIIDGALEIKAERREKSDQKDKNSYRSEFRFGSLVRRLALPDGVQQDDITASYKDGVLEVRTPVPTPAQQPPARKIEITRGQQQGPATAQPNRTAASRCGSGTVGRTLRTLCRRRDL